MNDIDDVVTTVRGDIPVRDAGRVLMHEHLLMNLQSIMVETADGSLPMDAPVTSSLLTLLRRNPIGNRDNCLLDDVNLQVEEVGEFGKLGGGTIVDATPPSLGRDVEGLRAISERSGLHIVAGCGHYTHPNHEEWVRTSSVDELAEKMISELVEGIGGTGIRAGLIGEIGTSDPLHDDERKVLRAATAAQQATGRSVYLHITSPNGHAVLDEMQSAGADFSRVVVGHQDLVMGTPQLSAAECEELFVSYLERGVTVGFDHCGKNFSLPKVPGMIGTGAWSPSDIERARMVGRLITQGWTDQLLISHDVAHKADLRHYGGDGYGHILRTFVPALHDVGVATDHIDRILIANPQRLLAHRS